MEIRKELYSFIPDEYNKIELKPEKKEKTIFKKQEEDQKYICLK